MIIRSGASEVSVPNETLGTRENNIYIQWYGCKLYAIHLDARSGPGMTPQSGIGGLILWLVYEPKRRPPKIVIHRSNGKSTEYMCNILLNTQNLTPFSGFRSPSSFFIRSGASGACVPNETLGTRE